MKSLYLEGVEEVGLKSVLATFYTQLLPKATMGLQAFLMIFIEYLYCVCWSFTLVKFIARRTRPEADDVLCNYCLQWEKFLQNSISRLKKVQNQSSDEKNPQKTLPYYATIVERNYRIFRVDCCVVLCGCGLRGEKSF